MIPARHVPSSTGRRGRQTRSPKAARAAPAAASAWARDRSGPAVIVPGRARAGRDAQARHLLLERQREIDAGPGPWRPGVGGRAQAGDQLELEERGLELGAQRPGLDPGRRLDGPLDGRPQRPAREVRADARAQIGRLADVEHRIVGVAEEVDARAGRHPLRQPAAGAHAPPLRRAQPDDVGHRGGAALLGQAEQAHEHLGRGQRVGERAVARAYLGVEPLCERAQVHALEPVSDEPPGQRDRVDHRRRQPGAAKATQVGVDEPDVEAGVVGHEHRAGAEAQELVEHRPHPRAAADVMGGDAGDLRDLGRHHAARDRPAAASGPPRRTRSCGRLPARRYATRRPACRWSRDRRRRTRPARAGRRGAVRPRPTRRARPRSRSARPGADRPAPLRRRAGGRGPRGRCEARRGRRPPRSARRVRGACTGARAGGPRRRA